MHNNLTLKDLENEHRNNIKALEKELKHKKVDLILHYLNISRHEIVFNLLINSISRFSIENKPLLENFYNQDDVCRKKILLKITKSKPILDHVVKWSCQIHHYNQKFDYLFNILKNLNSEQKKILEKNNNLIIENEQQVIEMIYFLKFDFKLFNEIIEPLNLDVKYIYRALSNIENFTFTKTEFLNLNLPSTQIELIEKILKIDLF